MTFYDIVHGLIRSAIFAIMPITTVILIYNYVRELWVFFLHHEDYSALKKPKIRHGEDGDTEVGTTDRLLFSYPFLICGFGFGTFWVLRAVMPGHS